MDQLRALSVRQPWAHAIVHLGKDIENRSRRFGHRGWTLIHASAGMDPEEFEDASAFIGAAGHGLPPRSALDRGGIIGVARIADSISAADPRSSSAWWMGPFGLVIDQAHPLPFVECKGTVAPLFWRPPADVFVRLRPALVALNLAP